MAFTKLRLLELHFKFFHFCFKPYGFFMQIQDDMMVVYFNIVNIILEYPAGLITSFTITASLFLSSIIWLAFDNARKTSSSCRGFIRYREADTSYPLGAYFLSAVVKTRKISLSYFRSMHQPLHSLNGMTLFFLSHLQSLPHIPAPWCIHQPACILILYVNADTNLFPFIL